MKKKLTNYLAMAMLMLAASCEGIEPQGDYVSLSASPQVWETAVPWTKAAPATSLPTTFRVWAYTGTSSAGSYGSSAYPDYMAAETFTFVSGSSWRSANKHGVLSSGNWIKYWALAPADAPSGGSYSLPAKNTVFTGASFTYTTPDASVNQPDLMVASATPVNGSAAASSLSFSHVLCQVRIHTAFDNVPAGSVTTVTLTNVKKVGTFSLNSGDWTSTSNPGNVSFTASQSLTTSSENVQIGTDAQTFMLLPQTLPSNSNLQVTVAGTTYSTSMSGVVLTKGRRVTLRVKFSDNSVTTGNDTSRAKPEGMVMTLESIEEE